MPPGARMPSRLRSKAAFRGFPYSATTAVLGAAFTLAAVWPGAAALAAPGDRWTPDRAFGGMQAKAIYSFQNRGDGDLPSWGGLVEGADGALYGTTLYGTVYKITTTGELTTLATFSGSLYAGLTLAGDGNFYGLTTSGGVAGKGTLFRMTPAGAVTTVHTFSGNNDGESPYYSLTLGRDGALYGVADGGANEGGVAYKLSTAGVFTLLHSFTGSECFSPVALTQGDDGNFYGACTQGGPSYEADSGYGTVYRMTPSGTVTVLHNFDYEQGAFPADAVMQASDGMLYGATSLGGDDDLWGVFFRMDVDGSNFEVLHSFTGGADGYSNKSALIEASDGYLYGTTSYGGQYGTGTIYRYRPGGGGQFQTVTSLRPDGRRAGGAYPYARLIEASDGALYGTCNEGGRDNLGTVFTLTSGR